MPARFVTNDRQTPMFLPPDLRDWLPANHIVHFILEAVEEIPESACTSTGAARAARNIRPA